MPKPQLARKILIVDPIHSDAIAHLEEHGFFVDAQLYPSQTELPTIMKNYDILVCRTNTKLAADFFERTPHLTCVALASTGYDQIDIESASKHNITVLGLPSSNKEIDVLTQGNFISTAEHAILLILAAAGNFYHATRSMKARQWEKPRFVGKEVYSKTLGFVGFGRVARLVANRAQAFGMKTIAYDPYVTDTEMQEHDTAKVDLKTLCSGSDIITIHAPKTNETIDLLAEKEFSQMKSGVIIVNTARSEIINKTALIAALDNGTVLRAALDVFINEPYDVEWDLVAHEKVITTPHIGGSTEEAQRRIALSTAEGIINFVKNGDRRNIINK